MSNTRIRNRNNQKKEEDHKIFLKKSITRATDIDYIKTFMYGATGCGSTWGALNALKSPKFKGDLIYINTDIPQNLKLNVIKLSEDEQKRLVIPTDENGEYLRVITRSMWNTLWKMLEKEYNDFSNTAGIVIDYIDNLYEAYIKEFDPVTPFDYRKPREAFKEEVWDRLMSARCNVIIIGKEQPVYVDVGKGEQYKKKSGSYVSMLDKGSISRWKVDLNLIIYREMRFREDRNRRKFVTIYEKHKLGLEPFELDGDNSNLFNNIFNHLINQNEKINKQK